MIGHGMPLDQFNPLLSAQLPDDPPDTASELPIDDPASVLRHKNNVILAVPADVRLALPVSHENLLPSERGGSLKGGSLLHSAARRNGRASASLTARGGGLPVGVKPGCGRLYMGMMQPPSTFTTHGYFGSRCRRAYRDTGIILPGSEPLPWHGSHGVYSITLTPLGQPGRAAAGCARARLTGRHQRAQGTPESRSLPGRTARR